ncbi:MAG: CDC48 family AAA ATPase [Candidatus Woesearchaeota archaeon]
MSEKKIQLKVIESTQDDVNKGIVRMDVVAMKTIGVTPGMFVSIKGQRTSVAIVDRALPGDIGLNVVRMDGLTRRNVKASIGEIVSISKAEIVEAKTVTIAPVKEGIQIRANSDFFLQALLGRAVSKGDLVSLGGTNRRRSLGINFGEENFEEQYLNRFSSFGLADLKFIVTECNPKQAVLINEQTQVKYLNEVANLEELEKEIPDISYEDIGGLDGELKKVREMIEVPLKHPEVFETLGIEPPKGVLLHGPPGTGKTLLAKAVAAESDSKFYVINGPEIMGKFYGQSEENLRKIFDEAEKNAPSIIFIDELDAIAPKREESKGEVERRVVAQLLTIMDGLKSRGRVVVMAATNIPNSIDPALRRPGRFDREIEINPPSIEARKKILKIHTRNMPLQPTYEIETAKKSIEQKVLELKLEIVDLKDEQLITNKKKLINSFEEMLKKLSGLNQNDFEQIMGGVSQSILSNDQKRDLDNLLLDTILSDFAQITHGFVGADLASLAKESAMVVLRKVLEDLNIKDDEPIPQEVLTKIRITKEDMFTALKSVRPSAMREVLIEKPNVTYNSIGGLVTVKQELLEAVEWPLKHKPVFKRMGIKPPKGVLLYGPPGTGKTMLAKAIANESEANFISVKGPELLSKWVGESEKGIREIFKKARQVSPAIIFFDEIDAIAQNRMGGHDDKVGARVVNQLLTEMDGMQELNDVIVIAATNRPDMMDTALLRPGRFDRIILVGIPDTDARKNIFEVHTKEMPLAKDVKLSELVSRTEGYVGADIEAVCREAAMLELRKKIDAKHVSMESFEEALKKVNPSATKEIQDAYEEIQAKFSQAAGAKFREEKPSYYG